MTRVSRNDLYVRDERGPSWFEDFLRSFANSRPSSVQEILDAIYNRSHSTVESIVKDYRKQVGLDILSEEDVRDNVRQASKKEDKYDESDVPEIDRLLKSLDTLTEKGVSRELRESFKKLLKSIKNEAKPISVRQASVLKPIAPMRLKKIKSPEDILKNNKPENILVQIKLDGFKVQAIKDKSGAVKLYTRRGEDFTSNVPFLVKELENKVPPGTFLLGELVWETPEGKQSLSDIQTVVGSSPEKAQNKVNEGKGKPVFYVYDLLWKKSDNITKDSYIKRYDELKNMLGKAGKYVKVVENYSFDKKDKALHDALKINAEGIVLKPKDSKYLYNVKGSSEPTGSWAKYKPGAKAKTDEVILKEYTKGEDKLIFPMYQYKGKDLFEVGKLSGMSKSDEQKIKSRIDKGERVVVEVNFQERLPSGKLRHAGWSRFRPDKAAKEVKVSKSEFRPLSVRHAADENIDIVNIIENDQQLLSAISNLCRHSGGNKSVHAIINFIRENLGPEIVSHNDDKLVEYIRSMKESFLPEGISKRDVGPLGISERNINFEDDMADYATHGAR